MPRLFYCTAIDDEDPDGVVTYYAFCSESQAAADDAANDEDAAGQDAADDDVTQLVMTPKSRTSPPHRLVGQWMMPAMVGVGSIAGILAAAASPPSHI